MPTTINPTGYCYHCKQNVLLRREDIDICLALILLIFTAGIGLVIYLAIYYSKEEDRCVHCGATCTQTLNRSNSQPTQQISNQTPHEVSSLPIQEVVENHAKDVHFCPFCGDSIQQVGVKFCPNCGSKV